MYSQYYSVQFIIKCTRLSSETCLNDLCMSFTNVKSILGHEYNLFYDYFVFV